MILEVARRRGFETARRRFELGIIEIRRKALNLEARGQSVSVRDCEARWRRKKAPNLEARGFSSLSSSLVLSSCDLYRGHEVSLLCIEVIFCGCLFVLLVTAVPGVFCELSEGSSWTVDSNKVLVFVH